jgi:AcrR family transcriptional regulator
MPRTKEQNEAIRAEKRQLIMDAALQLFAEDGYTHTSIDKIASNAGISKGLIYTYFEDKEDLLRQIFLSGTQKIAEAGLFQEEITTESLIDSIEKSFDMMTEQSNFFKLYTALSTQPGIAQKMGEIINTNQEVNTLFSYFQKYYGDKAIHEALLFSTIAKGYSILALYGDRQNVIPVDLLKTIVMNFIRERWGNSEE